MRASRSGSAVLLCLALAAIAAMVGYAFLRAASRQDMSGRSEMLVALARDAAQSGLAHATEQILLDFNGPELPIADAFGAQVVKAAPTFLDGPFCAPFVSYSNPYSLSAPSASTPNDWDSVNRDNHVLTPFVFRDAQDSSARSWHTTYGTQIYDGRGRYIEVGYHNRARPNPSGPTPEPVAALQFTDMLAANPEVSSGLFLDEELHRLPGGSSASNRQNARYRVRYVVGVTDLAGQILSNPLADADYDWKIADNDYRKPPQWLHASAYAWENMTGLWGSGYSQFAARTQHVFRGRGSASNTDRAWDLSSDPNPVVHSARWGLPATFPWMLRTLPDTSNQTTLYWGTFSGEPTPYAYPGKPGTYEPIVQNIGGNAIITPIARGANTSDFHAYAHAYMGPQLSWYNHYAAVRGFRASTTILLGQLKANCMTAITPFGRRLEVGGGDPAAWKWYQGRVDTPWQVNVLTAAPQTINQMILAYLPPHLKKLHYASDTYYAKTGEVIKTGSDGKPYVEETYSSTATKVDYNGLDAFGDPIGWSGGDFGGYDILNDQLGSGFVDFPAPASVGIKPDYRITPPVADLYPGPLCRGDSLQADQGSDDLGKYIDVDARGIGRCTHTKNPLIFLGGSNQVRYEDDPAAPAPWRKWKIIRSIDTKKFVYRYSYFWDLADAMSMAISYAKSTWVQYPNTVFDPSVGFNPNTLRNRSDCDSIQKIDALFLRQLGENFTAPGTPCDQKPIVIVEATPGGKLRFEESSDAVSNTIHSLVDTELIKTDDGSGFTGVAATERGKVMERMLNDWRLSFFGASPKYSESFRPLDFDGDHKVHCSAYNEHSAKTAAEVKYKTTRWSDADGSGRGPKVPNDRWFCVTGCFFIGKSRYYRILCRGELYDMMLEKPVAAQTVEKVLAIDPEGMQFPAVNAISALDQTLFQRWHYNVDASELPRQSR